MRNESFSGEVVAAASQNVKERNYWLEKLNGKLERIFFPFDYPHMAHEGKMETLNFTFPGEVASRLIQLSKGLDYTLHMILIAGVISVIEKYTGCNDIMVGAPIYKQKTEGRYINTILVLRHQIKEVRSFKELLLLVRQTIVEATEHQNYPLETLLYKLNIEYKEGDFPLFDIAVLLENIHDKKYIQNINLNTIFSFLRTDDSIVGTVEYNPQRYLKVSIERYINHLINFLREALFNVDKPMDKIEILSEVERKQLIHDFNDTSEAIEYLEEKTIFSLFVDQVEEGPANMAVKGPSHFGPELVEGESLTYEMLSRKARQLADFLVKKGIRNGDIVGIMVNRSLEMIVGMLGVLKIGGAYLPIDSEYPDSRVEYILRDSNAKLLLTKECQKNRIVSEIETIAFDLENSIFDEEPSKLESEARAADIAYIIYTSGSTGKPKGVMVEHRSIVNTLFWRKNTYQFSREDRVMQIPSFSFDSSVEDIFTPLISGSGLVLLLEENRYNVEYLRNVIERNKISHFLIVPGFYKVLLTEIPGALKRLKSVTVAGEGFTEILVKNHFEMLPDVRLFNEYGPTENSVCSTVYEFGLNKTKVLIGKPITNVSCYICNTKGLLAPLGAYGELRVSGKGLARGYLNNPELTIEKFVDNHYLGKTRMYSTGDMARWKIDGNLEYAGRQDHQVKIRGFRIELGEIEEQLLKNETVKEALVVVKEDKNSEKYLCAYLVSDVKISVPLLKECLSKDLPDYMIPSKYMQLSQFPLFVNGKVDRKALPEPEIDAGEEYIPPRDELERKLIGLWADVLGLQPEIIGIDSDFFNLGGHSLSATILVSKIHKGFNTKLPLKELFVSSTVRQLTAILRESVQEEFVSIGPCEEKEYYSVSSSQNRLYILQQMDLDLTAYNVPLTVELEGELSKEKLEDIFRKLIDRHESLRTSFHILDSKSVQKLHRNVEFEIEYFDTFGDEGEVARIFENLIRPFDLSIAPLLRVGLIKIDGLRKILIVDMHHIITDGISHGILINDFISLFNNVPLSPLRIQYKDYSEWLQSREVQNALFKQEKFWMTEFEGDIPVLNLSTDYKRPPVQSFEGKSIVFDIIEEETAALNELARTEGVTLFMVLLAIYNIFLFKLSSQEDIVVGTPIACRRHADLEKIVGVFINTLALRNRPSGQKAFRLFLSEIKEKTIKAFDNQDYQFEDLIEKILVQRNMSRNPLFDVLFELQNMYDLPGEKSDREMEGLIIKPYLHENKTSKFDFTLTSMEAEGKLHFSIEYCTRLFKDETIFQFIQYFKKIISFIIEFPGKKIAEIECITEEEKDRLLYEFNNTASGYKGDKTIHRLFEEQSERTPDNAVLIFCSGEYNGHKNNNDIISITYKELNVRADRSVHLLREKGVEAGTIAAIKIERSIDMMIGILGILKAGGAYLPIDPNFPTERINYMLADSGARVLLTDGDSEIGIEAVDRMINANCELRSINFNSLIGEPGESFHNSSFTVPHSGDLAYVIYTSGTTGNPKGVLVEHRNVTAYFDAFFKAFGVKKSDTSIQLASYTFDAFVEEVFSVLLQGGKLVIPSQTEMIDIYALGDLIHKHHVNIIDCTPLLLNEFDKLGMFIPGPRVRALNYIFISGGDVLKEEYVKNLLSVGDVYNTYGPTESTICATYFRYCGESKGEWDGGSIPIGKPLSNYRAYILNKYRGLQPVGVAGELYIFGPGVTRGYLNRPELTAEKYISLSTLTADHSPLLLYKSGDLARWLSDGNIEFLGRVDHQVKIRGFRIELGEIESLLLRHPRIKDAVVVVRGDGAGDKNLAAYFVSDIDAPDTELREYLLKVLPDYMIPSYFMQLEKMPLTPNGKIDYHALPAPGLKPGIGYAAPRDEIEERLLGLWAEVLSGKDMPATQLNIGIDSNFFHSGGHSLKATILASKIYKTFNVRLPLAEIFRTPTVREIAKYIKNSEKEKYASIEKAEEKEYYELSTSQKGLYILHQVNENSVGYNMPGIAKLDGFFEKEKLEDSFRKLIMRHESLRTAFVVIGRQPVQVIRKEVDFAMGFIKGEKKNLKEIFQLFIRPFDLGKAPLLRVSLVEVENNELWLMTDVHHIISDEISSNLLLRDFMAIYEGKELFPLRLQYKDYSEWKNKIIEHAGESTQMQEEFWLKEFEGEIPILNFPTDYPRGFIKSYDGDYVSFTIDEELCRKVRGISYETGATVNMVLMAVYYILLSKYANQEDIIIGSPVFGRKHIDLLDIMGLFVNMLALRNKPQSDKSFRGFLSEVKQKMILAMENQDYHFGQLTTKLGIQGRANQNPLFDVVFRMNDGGAGDNTSQQKSSRPDAAKNVDILHSVPFDLILVATAFEDVIEMVLMYQVALFERARIEKITKRYIEILNQVTASPDIKINDIQVSHGLLSLEAKSKNEDGDFGF